MDVTFIFENLQEFFFMSLGVKIRRFPMTLHVGLITVLRYRVACDTVIQYR